MAVNSITPQTMNRISGLSSGMDTDTMVKNLMKLQQTKYDKMVQAKTRAEWKRDAYTDVNNALRKFKEEYTSFLNNKSNMTSVAAYKSFTTDVAANAGLSATATAAAREGNFTVKVTQLAQGATMTGAKASATVDGFSAGVIANTPIGSIASFASGQTVSDDIKFSVNGTDFSFKATDSLRKVMDTVNSSDAGVTMRYSQLNDAFTFESKAAGVYDPGLVKPAEVPSFNYVYDGTLTKPETMAQPAAGAPQEELDAFEDYQQALKAYQDDFDTRKTEAQKNHQTQLVRYNNDLAAYQDNQKRVLHVTDTSGFLNTIGLDPATAVKTDAKAALLTVNGVAISRNANDFELDGVTFKLTNVTTSDISFAVKRDTQKSVDTIKGFVDAYNGLMDTLYGKLTEKKNYGYAPLTSEQRGELSEEDARQWDIKARAGLLGRDPALQTLVDKLQLAFTSAIGDQGALASVGISGSVYEYKTAAHMQLDEDRLRKALETDADKVYKMFANRVVDEKDRTITSQSGLITRITNAMDTFVTGTREVTLNTLNNSIHDWDSKMKTESTRLYNLQESYYKKFAAMEAALTRMQSQTSALSGFGMGG